MTAALISYSISFFRAASYIFTVLAWLWLGMLLAPPLVDSGALGVFLPSQFAQPVEPSPAPDSSSPLLLVVGAAVTLLMVVISIVILWRLPKTVSKTGQHISKSVTHAAMPILTHHKKLPKKKQRALSARVLVYVRVSLAVLPFVGMVLAPPLDDFDYGISVVVGGWVVSAALLSLLLEYGLRYLHKGKHLNA